MAFPLEELRFDEVSPVLLRGGGCTLSSLSFLLAALFPRSAELLTEASQGEVVPTTVGDQGRGLGRRAAMATIPHHASLANNLGPQFLITNVIDRLT